MGYGIGIRLKPLSIRERKTMSSGTSFFLRISFITSRYLPDLLRYRANLSLILSAKRVMFRLTA